MLDGVVVTEPEEMAMALDRITVGFDERVTVPLLIWTPLDSVTVATDDGIVVGFEDRVTVGLDESVNVPEETAIADDGITVKLLDGVTVAFDDRVTPMALPTVDSATTRADMVEVTALDPAVTQAVLPPLMIETAPDETDVIDGNEERITVGFEESVTVPLLIAIALDIANDGAEESVTVQTLEGMTVGFDDSVMVPELIARALEMPTETDSGPSVDSATTSAAMVDVTALDPATTVAWLAPPTPPRIETWLDPAVVTEKLLNEEMATASAGDAEVTVAVTTPATLAPFAMATMPDDSDVIVGLDESVTVTADDGVTVTADAWLTLTIDDGVTVPDETATVFVTPVDNATVMFDEGVIETTEDGITVGLEERVTVPDEIAIALEMANDGAEDSVTVNTLDGITVGLDESVTVPEETEIAEERENGGAEESATVKTLDGITVGFEESEMVPELTTTAGTPVIATLMFDDGVIVSADDGVTLREPTEEPQKSPTLTTWRCEASGCCTVCTSVADEGVAGDELWNWTLLTTRYLL